MKRILLSIVSVAMATAMMAQTFDHEVTQPAHRLPSSASRPAPTAVKPSCSLLTADSWLPFSAASTSPA